MIPLLTFDFVHGCERLLRFRINLEVLDIDVRPHEERLSELTAFWPEDMNTTRVHSVVPDHDQVLAIGRDGNGGDRVLVVIRAVAMDLPESLVILFAKQDREPDRYLVLFSFLVFLQLANGSDISICVYDPSIRPSGDIRERLAGQLDSPGRAPVDHAAGGDFQLCPVALRVSAHGRIPPRAPCPWAPSVTSEGCGAS